MASKRELKKKVKKMVNVVLDECDYQMVTKGKNADKADKLIDEAVDFHGDILPKIVAAKSKKDFNEIVITVNKVQADFVKKLNAL